MIKLTRVVALAAVLATTAGGVAVAAPQESSTVHMRLPSPTGGFPVGRDALHLVDRTRVDPWVPEAGARELMISLYYPALVGFGVRVPYATTEEARLLIEAQGLGGVVTAETLAGTRTNGRLGVPPAPGRHPMVLLSPGIGAPRYTLTTLAEDLASRGYVVAAIDHAYESVGTAFPGGRMLTCVGCEKAQTEEDLRLMTTGRGRDVSFVVDRLTGPHPAWRHAHMIDKSRIGMAGHSIGGASAVSAMLGDARVRAGINLDGAFHDPVPAGGLGRPFLMLGTDDDVHRPGGRDRTWDAAWANLAGWRRWLTVAGAEHFSFSDWPTLANQLGLPNPGLPADRAIAITRDYVSAFFDLHLRGLPRPVLDGPTPANPEVRFN